MSVVEEARSGRGRLVLIGGEAGIGKTTLVEYFLEHDLDPAVRVLTGACYDVDSPPPYGLWRDVLWSLQDSDRSSYDDALPAAFPDQISLFNDAQQRLTLLTGDEPAVVVLEDAHWSDRESMDLLRAIGRRIRHSPLLIIVTYRDDEINAGQPFYESLLPLVRECGAARIDLRRLKRRDIADLVRARYDLDPADFDCLVDELTRRTDGNPLFIEELLRTFELADLFTVEDGRFQLSELVNIEIPLLVRQLIERRLQQLDPTAREMLQTAAILGFEVRPELLIAVTGKQESDLSGFVQQAVDAFLLDQPTGRRQLRFRHALVQEALYSLTPLLWRQAQHRRVGEILSEMPDTDPAMVAEHFRHAGDRRASTWLLHAARHAYRLFAPHAVIQHLSIVLDNPGSLATDEQVEAYRLRGWAHEMTGAFHSANRDFLAELRAAIDTSDRHSELDALVRLAGLWTGRDYQRVGEYVEQALQVAADMNDLSLLAQGHNRVGTWCMSQDDPDRARQHHEQALQICERIDDQSGIAESRDLLGLTLLLAGDMHGAAEHNDIARSISHALNDQRGLSNSCANSVFFGPTYLSDTAVTTATLSEGVREGERALKTAMEIDYRAGIVYARVRLVSCLGAHGSYQRARDMMQRSIMEAEQIENRQLLSAAHAMAALLCLDLFNLEGAQRHAELSRGIAEQIGSTFRSRMGAAILAMASLTPGNESKAEVDFRSTWTDDVPARTLAQQLLWRARIELELSRGNPGGAVRIIDSLLGSTPYASRERPPLRTSLLRGRALNDLQQFDEAISWLAPARTLAEQQGATALLWRLDAALGQAHSGRGDPQVASRTYADARKLVQELAATLTDPGEKSRFLDGAYARIPEPVEATPLQVAKHTAGGLTRRQRQVAILVAEGRSNRLIADTLSISERTVESHVSSILATLDLTSRAQIVAWCIDHGLSNRSGTPS